MGAIDADAHVIETVQTWSYLDEGDRRFTPQLMTQTFGADLFSNEGNAVRDFWVIEGRRTIHQPSSMPFICCVNDLADYTRRGQENSRDKPEKLLRPQ